MATFTGTAELETITGTADGDLITLINGDTVVAAAGNDTITSDTVSSASGSSINGDDGDDNVTGGAGNDSIDGGRGNDSLRGFAGDDTVAGGIGDDTLRGGAANDVLTGDLGNDSIAGQSGNDNVSGGDNNDTVAGGAGDDTVSGGFGADSVAGGSGNDSLDGGEGDDTVVTGVGADTVTTGEGSDTIFLVTETDIALRDVVTDFVSGEDVFNLSRVSGITAFNQLTISSSGSDALVTGAGVNLLIKNVLASSLTASDFGLPASQSTVSGSGGGSSVGSQSFTLTSGDDTFSGEANGDTFFTTAANYGSGDRLYGNGGTDTLSISGGGTLALNATVNNSIERVVVSDSNNTSITLLAASSSHVTGGSGNDTFTFDAVSRAFGGDTLVGGAGSADVLSLVTTADTITDSELSNVTGIERIVLGDVDGFDLTLGTNASTSGITNISGAALAGGNNFRLDIAALTAAATVTGGASGDTIIADHGSDSIDAAGGNDSISYAGGTFDNATITGGAGAADRLVLTSAVNEGDDSVFGDTVGSLATLEIIEFGDFNAQVLVAGTNFDNSGIVQFDADGIVTSTNEINLNASTYTVNVTILGGAGNDTLQSGSGNDTINSGSGNDSIVAGGGNDTISTIAGDDTVTGGAGRDLINLSAGAQALVYTTATDSQATDAATFAGDTVDAFDFDSADTFDVTTITGLTATAATLATADLVSLLTDLEAANTELDDNMDGTGNDAVLLTISAGTAAGLYVVIDSDASGTYEGANDVVILLTNATNTGSFDAADFI